MTSTRGAPLTTKYKGREINIQWDLDWHLKIDNQPSGRMFVTLEAAEEAGKKMIDNDEKVKKEKRND